MATVLVAREKYQEALEALKPAIEANPTVNGLKVIYNKVLEMYNEQQRVKNKDRVAGSVVMNNFVKPKSAGAQMDAGAGASAGVGAEVGASAGVGAGQVMSQQQMQEALARLQAEANRPKTEEELAKEKEEEEKSRALAQRNSLIWGVIGGVALVSLLLFKKLRR